MRILFLITRADTVGGAQGHVRDLAASLIQNQQEVLVLTGSRGIYNTVLNKLGIKSIACETLQKQINPVKDWQTLLFFIKTIRQFQPDIVTTHSSKAGILGRMACQITKTPCIYTAHGWSFTEGIPQPSRTIYLLLERLAETLADKIICVSENDRKLGINSGMNPERLITVHNGIQDISNNFRANPSNSDSVKIVMVARFDLQKDHITLIKAFENIEGAKLVFVGDGPKLDEMKNYVNQRGLVERVEFLGYRQNIPEILAQAHIFASISHWEGFPYTIIEAMRAQLPVIASNVGGVAEAVIDGVTGYCISRSDVDNLKDRLAKLVNNAQLRYELGSKGRQIYESEFTFQQMFTKTYEVYEQVLKQRSKN